MGKYYAILLKTEEEYNYDEIDWDSLYSENDARADRLTTFGNTWVELNHNFYENNRAAFENLVSDLFDNFDKDNSKSDEAVLQDIVKICNCHCVRENKKPLSARDVFELVNIADNYYYDWQAIFLDSLCKFLEIKYEEPFRRGTFRGSSPSEWTEYICPASISSEHLNYIEAVFFGTGIYFLVSNKELDPSIEWPDLDDDTEFSPYFAPWMDDKHLKTYVAKELGKPESKVEVLSEEEYQDIREKYIDLKYPGEKFKWKLVFYKPDGAQLEATVIGTQEYINLPIDKFKKDGWVFSDSQKLEKVQ